MMFSPIVFVHPLRVARLRVADDRDERRLVCFRGRGHRRKAHASGWIVGGLVVTAAYFLALPFLRHSPWA